jgi:hypothetical protein
MEPTNRPGQAQPSGSEPIVQRIALNASKPDLWLSPEQNQALRAIVAGARAEAGTAVAPTRISKAQAGAGTRALIVAPNTATAMNATAVLANELGRDVHRVDLGRVVSKDAGDTEKNLARVFDEAQQAGAVLLFDEADALFGKRTEVKDSHDRYANLDTSYLLQRLETYPGLAILATNRKENLDEAFVRRIRHVVSLT